MSGAVQSIQIVQLPGNTLLHSEVHAAVMDVAREKNTEPKTITYWRRGEQIRLYHAVVNTGADVGHHESLLQDHESTVGAYKIFTYDEFLVTFTNGLIVKFMTPELIAQKWRVKE